MMFVLRDASSLNKMNNSFKNDFIKDFSGYYRDKLFKDDYIRIFKERFPEFDVDFSKADFSNGSSSVVELICKKHNKSHFVLAKDLTSGTYSGCEDCIKERRKLRSEKIRKENIEEFKKLIDSQYPDSTYDLNEYKNISTKFRIITKEGEELYLKLNEFRKKLNIESNYRHSKDIESEIISGLIEKFPNIDFSKFEYINLTTPVILRCKIHNTEFSIRPDSILRAIKSKEFRDLCEQCKYEKLLKEKTEWFKATFRERHPDLDYIDLSKVEFFSFKKTKWIILKCLKHNIEFKAKSEVLIKGLCGCPICAEEVRTESRRLTNQNRLIEFIHKHYPNIGTEKIYYNGHLTPVCLTCRFHPKEEFWLTPWAIKYDFPRRGYKNNICPFCIEEQKKKNMTDDFIRKAKVVHGDKYDYSNINYIGLEHIVTGIKCNKCGSIVSQSAGSHLCGYNACSCYKNEPSIGERYLRKWFSENNLPGKFIYQQTIKNNELLYDNLNENCIIVDGIYSSENKVYWIEINGEQHTKPVSGPFKGFNYEKQIIRDECVRRHCKSSGIILIEISHKYNTYEKISNVLESIIIDGKSPDSVLEYPKIEDFNLVTKFFDNNEG